MVTTRFEDKRVYIAQQYALSICGKTIGIEIAKAIAVAARPFNYQVPQLRDVAPQLRDALSNYPWRQNHSYAPTWQVVLHGPRNR